MWLSAEAVLQRVARFYRLRVADLVRRSPRPGEARQVALYGLRREAGQGLQGIARRMGLSYGGVSRHVHVVAGRLTSDRRFRQRVKSALRVKVQSDPLFPCFLSHLFLSPLSWGGSLRKRILERNAEEDERPTVEKYDYPFEQFLNHFRAMITVRQYREVLTDYDNLRDPLYIGEAREWEAQLLRILDYMAQDVPDRPERLRKTITFLTIVHYIADNRDKFKEAGLALPGEGERPASIAKSVLQAVHSFFSAPEPPETWEVDAQNVIDLARRFEGGEAGS